jgi:hypothetical protein
LGALLISAIQHDTDTAPGQCNPQTSEACAPLAEHRADALLHLIECATTDISASNTDRYTVHIDYDDAALSEAARERLTCDASTVTYLHGPEGEPLPVGRKTRTIPTALRRALQRRDKGCRYPGCTHTRFVDAHHVHHWAHGGATRLDNLVLLCRRHHRAIHDIRAYIQLHRPATGAVQFHFYTADGERLLVTGDRCLAEANVMPLPAKSVADVSAVTSAANSPFAPVSPTARPDYREIAWFLAKHGPPGD